MGKRFRVALVTVIIAGVFLVLLAFVGVPPAGPIGSVKSATPLDVATATRAVASYVGNQVDGRAWLLRVSTWTGGLSETDAPLPADSIYAGFRGVAIGRRWPFVTHFNGYVSKNPGYGLRIQYQLERTALEPRSTATLSSSEKELLIERAFAYLQAVDLAREYADETARSLSVGNDADGLLTVTGVLPSEPGTTAPGELDVLFTPNLKPQVGILDSVRER